MYTIYNYMSELSEYTLLTNNPMFSSCLVMTSANKSSYL